MGFAECTSRTLTNVTVYLPSTNTETGWCQVGKPLLLPGNKSCWSSFLCFRPFLECTGLLWGGLLDRLSWDSKSLQLCRSLNKERKFMLFWHSSSLHHWKRLYMSGCIVALSRHDLRHNSKITPIHPVWTSAFIKYESSQIHHREMLSGSLNVYPFNINHTLCISIAFCFYFFYGTLSTFF